MKFFSIGRTNDISIIGYYPQTERTKNAGYHVENKISERKVKVNFFPEFTPRYGLDLHPKSNETDVLDRGTIDFGFVISEKLKCILNRFNLPPHRFYPIDVYNANNSFYWFHYIGEIEQYINFEETRIEVYKSLPPFTVKEELSIAFDKILDLSKALVSNRGWSIRYSNIMLTKDFPNYDWFEITGAQCFTLISTKLKDEFENQKITGLEYLVYDKIHLNLTL